MRTSHLHTRLQDFIAKAKHPLIVILGQTASGKTAFSIELGIAIGTVEIINADSRQLYKYLDVGTAKITREEMRGIPHHLLDVLDPKQEATAAWYKHQAENVIHDIHGRGHVPILVGGSMLYISAVSDDLQFPVERTQRKSLQARKEMKPRDDLFVIGVTRPRAELALRINARTERMLAAGWIDEVTSLLKRGYGPDDPGMKSHGYREIMEWLYHGSQAHHDIPRELHEKISRQTRQYAKRQMTWWKGDDRIHWITPQIA